MQTEGGSRHWYLKPRYLILIIILIALLIVSLVTYIIPAAPKTANQVRLDGTIAYFAHSYDPTTGLIPETPGGTTFWLYSDNYLAVLAVSRYDPGNQSTSSFASALDAALGGYVATLPPTLAQNQYTALNSTVASFGCSSTYGLSWSQGTQPVSGNGSARLMTTANGQDQACASKNYADLLLLQAIYQHRLGNSGQALNLYHQAESDFDGHGFADLAYNSANSTSYHVYQTYKVALYVYATYCLGQQASTSALIPATSTLLYLQSNSTGGFITGYTLNLTALNAPPVTAGHGVNTETTALAALALELMIKPSSSC